MEAKILAEKREHMILKPVRHLACVSAGINVEAVRDSILIKNLVEFYGIGSQTVLVAYVYGDRTIPAETSDVLIDESERRIGGPFCKHVRLRRSVFRGQIEIERRIFRIG